MSRRADEEETGGGRAGSWAIVLLIVTFIVVYGAVVFLAVGDKGPPKWGFGALPDVPGESAYSTERKP